MQYIWIKYYTPIWPFCQAWPQKRLKYMDFPILTLSLGDAGYPALLKEISDPPSRFYYRGSLHSLEQNCLAIVGTRKMTDYGGVATARLAKKLAAAGLTIISGLAYGVDAAAHQAALDVGGLTVAVLGCGLDDNDIYPPGNRRLARQILDSGGALISEYASGMPSFRYNFLARNRIIAGLSFGTLVVECPEKSGALITAKHALEYNRDVYAVPGPITSPQSAGTNRLIKAGARMVTEAQDILDDLHIVAPNESMPIQPKLSADEQKIINCLMEGKSLPTDAIIEQTRLPAQTVLITLTFLEMNGIIKQLSSQQYILNPL
jgi:DNA processing protein